MSGKMPVEPLADGNEIPRIGLGTYRLEGEECLETVETALRLGYDHIDTAEMYGNEGKVGEAIEDSNREDLFITSKVWPTNLRHDDVLTACNSSLERLGTSYLDLYLIHWPNDSIPLTETIRAMEELHDDGKIRSIGVSNFTKSQVEEAVEIAEIPITVNQVEFHPWLHQEDLLEFCEEREISIISYAPLARTQIFDDRVIQKLARKYERPPAQIALRWEIQVGVVPIPKSSSEDHLRENIQIFDWELNREDVEKINGIETEKRLVNMHYSNF